MERSSVGERGELQALFSSAPASASPCPALRDWLSAMSLSQLYLCLVLASCLAFSLAAIQVRQAAPGPIFRVRL